MFIAIYDFDYSVGAYSIFSRKVVTLGEIMNCPLELLQFKLEAGLVGDNRAVLDAMPFAG
jgi:hypothetical protein